MKLQPCCDPRLEQQRTCCMGAEELLSPQCSRLQVRGLELTRKRVPAEHPPAKHPCSLISAGRAGAAGTVPANVFGSALCFEVARMKPFASSSGILPPAPDAAAACDMPRKELGLEMAGSNSGSCDSMVSTASNHSQRCLMFLEETIGSLDAEADSGVSTDETDYVEPSKLPGTWPKRDSVPRDLESRAPPPSVGHQRAAEQKSSKSISTFSSSAPAAVPSPGYYSLPRSITVANAQRANGASDSKATVCTVEDPAPVGKSSQMAKEYRLDQASPGYYSLPRSITVANAQRANGASDSKATVCTVEDPVPVGKSSQEMAKEYRLDQANTRSQMKSLGSLIIQPPDPFQDDLVSHEWSRSNRSDAKRETVKETEAWTSWGQPEKLEEIPQDPDAKRGPPTAPKPRKLPPNIILKTSKNSPVPLTTELGHKVKAPPPFSAGSQPSSASNTTAEKANLGHLDPKEREKARQEALEKLGLSQDRRVSNTHLQPAMQAQPRQMPLPATGEPEALCGVAERSAPGIRQMNFKSNTLERSGVGLSSYLTSTKEQSVKTSSSLGKMSFIERLAPSFLRSSRPRPVSLGAGKDFAGLKEPGQVEPEKGSKWRSHPLQSFPKPSRSSVSVKISPKGATDENRREALKKLGLLKE
ncbi:PREDICTED: specifically androgen-regulated gene protein [Eurypyga helias]|uniref:specifically androgen-regulated gene protein n=1 Tax=Eurypyga helias TaxID=54383 RepID=UPI00052809B4|nr:PREDICTED: specifically androgen-regulated gene protein [Eurypyga helias]